MNTTVYSWAIYFDPLDYPALYVVRRFESVAGISNATDDVELFDTLDAARASIRPGLACIPRLPADHQSVVEVWL